MKAMIINQFGGPDVFEATDIPKPEVKPGHVLVRVEATSVNAIDTKMRKQGHKLKITPKFPALLGMDFAGTIQEVGEGVDKYSVGDAVYGCAGGVGELPGALAEFIVADAQLIARKPMNLSMREAAAMPLVGITAYEGLKRANVSKGQQVLVHGGLGGVGHIALQLARHFGADVHATGTGTKQLALIKTLGAKAINYQTEEVADYVEMYTKGAGFDVIFDSVGGSNIIKSFEAAALNGQVTSTLSLVEIDLHLAQLKGLSLHAVFILIPMLNNHKREEHGRILEKLTEIIEAGSLRPIINEQRYSLNDIGQAHAFLESGDALGKVVVEL